MSSTVDRSVRTIAALVVVIAVMLMSTQSVMAADWPNARGDAGNSGSSSETLALSLTERWHSSAPAVEENGAVVSNGVVYMSSDDGQLFAFDAGTGAVVTGFPVTASANMGSPAVDAVNGKVYVLAGSALYAFNLNGTSAWTADVGLTGSNYNVGPIVDGGFVYLKAGGNLQKYDSAGAQQWSVPTVGNDTQPAIMGGFVYVNGESGTINKYDKATGVEVTTGGFPITTPGSEAGLAVAGGRIFHKADQLYAYDASTGATVWSAPDGGDSTYYDSPAVSNGVVYVYGWDSKAYAFDAATGATMAGFPSVDLSTPNDRNWSSPAVAGDLVFIGAGTSQKLKVLGAAGSANAGIVLEEHSTFSADFQGFDLPSPIVSDGIVYAMLDGGGLYAFFASGVIFTGGGVTINGGDACTTSQSVTLTIDPGSNPDVSEMRISEDPLFTGAVFEPVATSKPFTLSAGFGTKTVYIQFKDTSAQLSNVFNDQIDYSATCGAATSPTKTTNTSDSTVQYSDVATLSGTLFSGANPLSGQLLAFTAGTQNTSGTTDGSGAASSTLQVTQKPGTVTKTTAAFAGDSSYDPSSEDKAFSITKEDCTLAYAGDILVLPAHMTTLAADMGELDSSLGDLSGKTIVFTVTDSSLATTTYNATTDSSGHASTTQALPAGVYGVSAAFASDDYYKSCSTPTDTVVTVESASAKVTGGGWISPGSLGKVSFGLNVIPQAGGTWKGQFQLRSNNGKAKFHGNTATNVVTSATNASWEGTGRWNGVPGYHYYIWLTDAGTSGKKGDTIRIVIKNPANTSTVFTTGGTENPLKGGNLVIH